ncbi:cytochrome P450 4V2-like [Oppia nitens]|uniref:cytochrome P450 4V2-like n=1 Tax=Oppia nitens TaxID=1686743 RepID=UPI0023DC267D|nr:cytochrome P450 4V2-like [Oppia nitens]
MNTVDVNTQNSYENITINNGINDTPIPTIETPPNSDNEDTQNLKQHDTYEALLSIAAQYHKSGVFRLWLGPFNPVIVITNATNAEKLLSTKANITKAHEYKYLRPWLGYGLLTSTGNQWRTSRKLLSPGFHFQILENFLPIIINQQNIMMFLIDKQIAENDGIVDDIRPLITNYTLDAICETAMGSTVRAQTSPNSDYVRAIQRMFAVSIIRFIKPWLWSDFIFYRTRMGQKFTQWLKVLHDFTESVIKEKKAEILEKINNFDKSSDITREEIIDKVMNTIGSKRRLVFMDLLLHYHLKHPDVMTELDIRSEVDTFMFGGHDTTSSSLMFTLLLIGLNSDVQKQIHEELDDIFNGDIDREITVEDIRQMKYLDQCIREGLRLYPPIQLIGRQIEKSFQLSDGCVIPGGMTCYVPLTAMHRDPKYFPDPEVFDPQRFDVDLVAKRHPYAYAPFSAGPRNCIGQKYAMLEEKAFLGQLFRKYSIESLVKREDVKLELSIVCKPSTPLKMKFKLRS